MTREDITSLLNQKVENFTGTENGRNEYTPVSNLTVERAVLVLFDRQTADEQFTESTSHHNGIGFTGADAPLLSSFARQITENKSNYPLGKRLSPKQMGYARRKVQKYVRQLLEEAEAKASRKAVAA